MYKIKSKLGETSNGQFILTLPRLFGDTLNLKKGDELIWELYKDEIVIKKFEVGVDDDGEEFKYN